jgi:hypothetical protein
MLLDLRFRGGDGCFLLSGLAGAEDAVFSVSDNAIVLGPWIEELVRRYQAPPTVASRPSRLGLALTAVVAVAGAAAPALLHLDHEAYPNEVEKQRALEACGRAEPIFVRFFASHRAACYERFPGLLDRAAAVQPSE